MSIVGTRPPLIGEVSEYELHHRARLAIKPGITGMWQVSGRSDITDFEEVVELDKEYIENWNIFIFSMFLEAASPDTFHSLFGFASFGDETMRALTSGGAISGLAFEKAYAAFICNLGLGMIFAEYICHKSYQKNLNSPSPKPVHYEEFQRLIAEKGFEYCLKKYGSMKMLNSDIIDMWLDNFGVYNPDAQAADFFAAVETAIAPTFEIPRELKQRFKKWIKTLVVQSDGRPFSMLVSLFTI